MGWNTTSLKSLADGIVYGIEAYGEEAIALHNETMELLKKGLGDNLTRDIL